MDEKYIGSDFDDFLEEEGLLADAESVAIMRVLAFQLKQLMDEQNVTIVELANRMDTSREVVTHLLDPSNDSATVMILERAAFALGKRLQVVLI